MLIALCLFCILAATGVFHSMIKDNPPGMSYRGQEYRVLESDIDFLYDLTYQNTAGEIVSEQQIFDTIFAGIDAAQQYILLDMFLFNSFGEMPDKNSRNLAGELTARLLEKKRKLPGMQIDVITDPINNIYEGAISQEVQALREAGVNVIYTDLEELRDSNLLYSPIWRLFFQWFGNSARGGIFPNPFSENGPDVTLRSYLIMLNFKANHRKIFLADQGQAITTIVSSANPHNGSSAHSNVALRIRGDFWQDVYTAESQVAEFSEGKLHTPNFPAFIITTDISERPLTVQLLTEDKIETELLTLLENTTSGDQVSIGTFYLSDQEVIGALVEAAQRGAAIHIILDPSNDAFGRDKYGIPNQPAAQELLTKSQRKIQIRWYVTHGEQYHAKFTFIKTADGTAHLLLGSANLTRRNLDNYNLELNVSVTADSSTRLMQAVERYYKRIWTNESGNLYTTEYSRHENRSFVKRAFYEAAEFGGLSTF